MKKILVGLFTLLSLTVLAGEMEDKLEKDLQTKMPTISDGTVTIPVHEYDVDLEDKKIKLEVELRGDNIKTEFDKMNKAKVEAYASALAKHLQEETKKNLPVEVEIKVDRDFLPDEKLYMNTFQ